MFWQVVGEIIKQQMIAEADKQAKKAGAGFGLGSIFNQMSKSADEDTMGSDMSELMEEYTKSKLGNALDEETGGGGGNTNKPTWNPGAFSGFRSGLMGREMPQQSNGYNMAHAGQQPSIPYDIGNFIGSTIRARAGMGQERTPERWEELLGLWAENQLANNEKNTSNGVESSQDTMSPQGGVLPSKPGGMSFGTPQQAFNNFRFGQLDTSGLPSLRTDKYASLGGEYDYRDKAIFNKELDLRSKEAEMSLELNKKKMELGLESEKKRLEDIAGAEKRLTPTKRFLQQYERSFNELSQKFPDIGKVGIDGWLARQGGRIANIFELLPETKALEIRVKPMANKMARDVEGGRVTDQDRQIYADSFANALLLPSTTNIRLASESLLELNDLGGNITPVLKQLKESKTPIIQKIYIQTLIGLGELEKKNEK